MAIHVSHEMYPLLDGELGLAERGRVEAHLRACTACRRELEAVREALGLLPLALGPTSSIEGRHRLFASVEQLERFSPYAPRVAAMLDTDVGVARRVLHALSDSDTWPTGPLHGQRFLRLEHILGPSRATGWAELSRFEPGFTFPRHRHVGTEELLVFQGEIVANASDVFVAGDVVKSPGGSSHELHVPVRSATPCLCLVVNQSEVELV